MRSNSVRFNCVCVTVEAAGGKALACVVDIRDERQVGEAVQKAVDKFGGTGLIYTDVRPDHVMKLRPLSGVTTVLVFDWQVSTSW